MKTHNMVKMFGVALLVSLLGGMDAKAEEPEKKSQEVKEKQPSAPVSAQEPISPQSLYTDLQKEPVDLKSLPQGFSSPQTLPAEPAPTDRAAQQLIGKVKVALQGGGEESILGYQVYENYAAAQRAFAAISAATDLGITTSIKRFHLTVQSPGQGKELALQCEGFNTPRLPDALSARCAVLHPSLPVIVTGLSTHKFPEDVISLTQVDDVRLVEAGLSRVEVIDRWDKAIKALADDMTKAFQRDLLKGSQERK